MSDLPHVFPTVVHMLAAAAVHAPQREALVCAGERLSYEQYLRCVASFAHELIALGVRGKRVGIVLGNSLDICIAMFAVHAAGAQASFVWAWRRRCKAWTASGRWPPTPTALTA